MRASNMSACMCVSDHACGGGSHIYMFGCLASAGLNFLEGFGSFASLGAVRNVVIYIYIYIYITEVTTATGECETTTKPMASLIYIGLQIEVRLHGNPLTCVTEAAADSLVGFGSWQERVVHAGMYCLRYILSEPPQVLCWRRLPGPCMHDSLPMPSAERACDFSIWPAPRSRCEVAKQQNQRQDISETLR